MAIFKGKPTGKKVKPSPIGFELLQSKLVQANPETIRYSGKDPPENWDWYNSFNEWDLVRDDNGLFYYQVNFYKWKDDKYHVIISLNINDSMRRIFEDRDRAQQCFDGIQPFTQKKTLRDRGFFTW